MWDYYARESTVVHLVVIYNNIIDICYRYPAMKLGRKPPNPTTRWPNREKFWEWIYPFHAISSNFGSAGRNPPSQAAKQGKFCEWIYPFHAISSNFGSAGRKAPALETLTSGGQYIKSVIWVRAAEWVTPRLTEQKGETCFPMRSTTRTKDHLLGTIPLWF